MLAKKDLYVLIFFTVLLTLFTNPSTVKAETQNTTYSVAYISNTRVNFRAEANLSSQIYKTLPTGIELDVSAYDAGGWSLVEIEGQSGYVKSEYITLKEKYSKEVFDSLTSEVELLSWNEVREIFTIYTPAQVYDVRTGLVYNIQSFSNGKHADVETLTKEDTNIMLQTYDGSWQWDPRPVWVSINGRTIAASINGMPHGSGTISGNGMNGQVCLHFKGSTTHNGNKAFTRDHQQSIDEAWALR